MRDRKFWDKNPVLPLLMCSLILFSAAVLNINIQPLQTAEATVADTCDDTISLRKITGAAASTSSPYRAVDVNFKTMWTSEGKGSWIKPDLGEKQTICHVDIDWYRGVSRQYDFTIYVSSDGSTWEPVYDGKSDGISRSFETYEFEDVDARWVKVRSNGNQYNMKNSIQELKVYGNKGVAAAPATIAISYPADGQSFPSGTTSVKISGSATSQLALRLVEVSINGGAFSPAAGTNSWSYVTGPLADGKSYTATVRATDSSGKTASAKASFSVQMPVPVPEPAPSQKFFKATLNTWASETEQSSLFKPYVTLSDEAKLHVALNHEVTAAEYSMVESIPHREKGLEFGSIAEIREYAPILAQKGYDYCDYDIEPGPNHTPQAEFDDFVNSIRTASSICHSAGLDFHCSPANWRLRQADTIEQVAPHCDQLHFQFQVVQQDPERYLAFSKEFSARARAANPDIVLAIQLSTQQEAAPGMSLLETFKKDWTSVKPYIDGVTVWWGNDSSSKATMTEFMTWFNSAGRG
jgi:hypothetical protein